MSDIFNNKLTDADWSQKAADESMVDRVVSDWISLADVTVHEDGANALIGTIAGLITRARFGKDLVPEAAEEQKLHAAVVLKTYKPGATAIVKFLAEQPRNAEAGQTLYVSASPCVARAGEVCELTDKLNEAREVFEAALSIATKADPSEAPFPLTGAAAKTWHDSHASALQWVLEMLPSSHAAPAEDVQATETWPYGVGVYGPANAGGGPAKVTSFDARILSLIEKAKAAERFISGFEGDETQDGVDDLLTGLRQAIDELATAGRPSNLG